MTRAGSVLQMRLAPTSQISAASFPLPTCPLCSFLALWALVFLQHTKTRTLRTSARKAGVDSEALSPGGKSPKWCDCHPLPFWQRYAWEVVFYAFSVGSWKALSAHSLFDCRTFSGSSLFFGRGRMPLVRSETSSLRAVC